MHQHNNDAIAPVAVYTYSRHKHLVETIEALRRNHLARDTVLYVVSDAASDPKDRSAVKAIRDYVDDLTGFREVVRIYRATNYGIPRSLDEAETMILSDHGRVINMEDDNITSANYLDFINAGLQYFEHDDTVYSICGYCPPVGATQGGIDGDFWRYAWNMSWGYGIWKRKHDLFHPLVNRYSEMRRSGLLAKQNRAGGLYVSDSLKRDFAGLKQFPDAVLCTDMFAAKMQSIIPTVSKVQNTGQDGSGQSTRKRTGKYDVVLDAGEQRAFNFSEESSLAGIFRDRSRSFYNGSAATKFARSLGIYQQLTAWRERWSFSALK